MGNKYNPKEAEQKRQQYWETEKIYDFDTVDETKPVYAIDTPPPTVSGKLHIGHIFSYTQAEVIARYKRMNGYNVYYPFGFDDNGLPTERLVEKELKIRAQDLPRREFTQKCLEITEKYREQFKTLWQSMGVSAWWSSAYSTIQPDVQKLVQTKFLDLLAQGTISRQQFPALRCTKCQTVIAQAEVEEKEIDNYFNDIKFTLEDGTDLVIATTRPELLPACVAVFVHPDDERFQSHIGKTVTTPLGVKVPLLGDTKVKMDKGTGAVMCCSYGDDTDVYWIKKHKLPEKIIVNRYGKFTETGIDALDGLKTVDAREKIMEILDEQGVVVKREKIVQSVCFTERGGVPVEIIPVDQWVVSMLSQKETFIKKAEEMKRYPEFMRKRYNDRVHNLERDRCISRNRYYGIPVPVRYSKKTGEVILPSKEQLPVDPYVDMPDHLPDGHTADDIIGEHDVLDTWFTSSQTPDINQQIVRDAGYKQSILPMDLRPQAHDIIRTRLFYTIVQSQYARQDIPFSDVMISGHVLAGKNEKISKSKGNAKFTPESLIEQHGADAVRYWALSGQLGKDIVFEEEALRNGKKLVNKLRNSFNFVKMQLDGFDPTASFDASTLYATDKRIIARTNEVIEQVRNYLEKFEYGIAKIHFEEYFRRDFCDTYLEMIKIRTYQPHRFDDGEAKKRSAQWTLYHCMLVIIKLIAPLLPHITEEIYQDFYQSFTGKKSIHVDDFPTEIVSFDMLGVSLDEIKTGFAHVYKVVQDVRKWKSDQQISLGAEIGVVTISGPVDYLAIVKEYADDIAGVTKAEKIVFESAEAIDYKIG